jgi:hypothetical protein
VFVGFLVAIILSIWSVLSNTIGFLIRLSDKVKISDEMQLKLRIVDLILPLAGIITMATVFNVVK